MPGGTAIRIGGAAVIDGVMMRGGHSWSVALRMADGTVRTIEGELASWQTPRVSGPLSWPIVRGCTSLASSLSLSLRALLISASLDTQSSQVDCPGPPAGMRWGALRRGLGLVAGIVGGVLLGLAAFVAAPALAASIVMGDQTAGNALAWSACEAAFRCAVLVAYLAAIGLDGRVRPVLAYHGAEHKAINCLEHSGKLTPAGCRASSRYHARCGTTFLVTTALVAVVVNALTPVPQLLDGMGLAGLARTAATACSRLALLPLVAGLSYELSVRWAGTHEKLPVARVLLLPGMLTQRLTTREPDDQMIECAILAAESVWSRDLREAWAAEHTPGGGPR